MAGLARIANKTDPGKRLDIHMFEEAGLKLKDELRWLTTNLLDALRLLDKADVLRAKLGDEFVSAFVKLKLMEWNAYSASLTE